MRDVASLPSGIQWLGHVWSEMGSIYSASRQYILHDQFEDEVNELQSDPFPLHFNAYLRLLFVI